MWHTHQRLIALQRAKGWPNIQITRAPPRLTCRALHLSPPPELGIDLGAILRSAAAAGVDGVVLPERRSAAVNETVVRASAGTAGRVPVCRVVNLSRTLEDLKAAGLWIYGLALGESSRDYLLEAFDRPTGLVMGAEGEGLHQKIREHCDGLLHIPMPGGVESLNVSAAAAVTLFRVLARRGAETPQPSSTPEVST